MLYDARNLLTTVTYETLHPMGPGEQDVLLVPGGSVIRGAYGYDAFGLSLFPLLIGIGLLFYNGRSIAGWLLTSGGALIILVGIVANLHVYLQPTSLFATLMMLGLMAGGIGFVARSLREA